MKTIQEKLIDLIAYTIAININYILTGKGEIKIIKEQELREFLKIEDSNDKSFVS